MHEPANDNHQPLPKNGSWVFPVFWISFLLMLGYAAYHAHASENIIDRASVIDGVIVASRS